MMETATKLLPLLGICNQQDNVFAVILMPREAGKGFDYIPIDFHGIEPAHKIQKKFNYGIFVPITHESAAHLTQRIESLKDNKTRQEFYFQSYRNNGFNPKYERRGKNPVDYDGSEFIVSDEEKATYERDPESPIIKPTNCMHFIFNACKHDAGIPLDSLDRYLHSTYEPGMLSQAVKNLEFYGEPLQGKAGCKMVGPINGTEAIVINASGRAFDIPEDIGNVTLAHGENAFTYLSQSSWPLASVKTHQVNNGAHQGGVVSATTRLSIPKMSDWQK